MKINLDVNGSIRISVYDAKTKEPLSESKAREVKNSISVGDLLIGLASKTICDLSLETLYTFDFNVVDMEYDVYEID